MIKPAHTLLFLLAVLAGGLLLAWGFPAEGIEVTEGFKLQFASLEELRGEDGDSLPAVDVVELLESYEEPVDSAAIQDSIRLATLAYRKQMLRIQYQDSNTHTLPHFFASLKQCKRSGKKVRIVHYGDSQIEGDRISALIRDRLQKEFGGSGPGYLAVKNVVNTSAISMSTSANWLRYPVFGKADSTLNHNRFGMYGAFCRFTPIYIPQEPDSLLAGSFATDSSIQQQATSTGDSLLTSTDSTGVETIIPGEESPLALQATAPQLEQAPTDTSTAWVELRPSSYSYLSARRYDLFELLYSNEQAPFRLRLLLGDSLLTEQTFLPQPGAQTYRYRLGKTPELLRVEFVAVESPDVYGLRLESSKGLALDNVGLRGSSGTFFGKISTAEMAQQFNRQPVRLILLQFGGNTVPHIDDEVRARRYGGWMRAQIRKLRRLNPKADIVLIGPSDMSVKEKTKMVTYPQLEYVRNALREAAFETGCGFWDIYEVMGGRNSMPSWVEADPPLAATDYTHFTRKGANKIAGLFVEALLKDYEDFETERSGPELASQAP